MSENEYKKQLVKAYRGLSGEDQHDEDTGTDSGGTGTGGAGIAYVDFIGTGTQINDQQIPVEKLNHLTRTHDPKTKTLIEQQKAERDKIQKIKRGLERPRDLTGENQFQTHPLLSQAAQFSGTVDQTVSPVPAENQDQDANPELRMKYDLRPQLQNAPRYMPTPHSTPRLTR